MRTPFKDLNLNSSFLFASALSDPDTCRIVLEIILGRKISKVNVKTENSIMLSSDVRCVRLDVNARDEFNVNYDIEAQNPSNGNIAKRSRFYQAEMDVAELKPSDSFDKLSDSYVIFICTFDPFGRGLYRYTFTEKCEEDGKPLGDGTCKIFFNTKGSNADEVPEELIHFLKYFENSTDDYVATVEDKSIMELHAKIIELKRSREKEAGYMKFAELLEETKQEGKLEGIEQGQYMATVKILLNLLAEKGDIPASLKDKIDSELNVGRLEEWVKLAIHSETIEEFENNM